LLRAKKRPNRANYRSVAVYCLLIIGSIIGILGHPLWGLFIILIVALFCLPILIAFTQKNLNAEIAEQLKKVNTSEPIKVKDLFMGWGLLLKLKRKYGTRKALIINSAIFIGLTAIMLVLLGYLIENLILINNKWYRGGYWPLIIAPLIAGGIILYNDAKSAIKNYENIFCTNCNTPVVTDAIFCTNCGKPLHS
jgi:4-hydroxybenzoate polyprenyltransferase